LDYTDLGKKTIDATYGIDGLLFVDLSQQLSLYGGVGLYGQETREVARSNATGWLYTQAKDTDLTVAYSAGLQYYPSRDFSFGLGYHSVRGPHAKISLKF
jgi:opacity protein-like surface antigen